jgi:ubiquinone/menaquinone biosynthesis C-methylase UbiE
MCSNNEDIKNEIRDFWTRYPCAKNIIKTPEIDKEFFLAHDRIIDKYMPGHYDIFKYDSCRGKKVLEVGCGMGAHARHCAAYAKEFYAVDLSPASVELTKKRFELFNVKGAHIQQGDAENLDFPEGFFDYVYSNGVIHHTPDTKKAVHEIYRVLRPGGRATVMIYNKNSVFYWVDLMLWGRMKYFILKMIPKGLVYSIFGKDSIAERLKNTLDRTPFGGLGDLALRFCDGYFNPHTKVYTKVQARRLFSEFKDVSIKLGSSKDRWLERIPFVDKYLGWGLFIFAEK